ncbi:DNA adenine methylase [Brevibacillus laterosporus]|uniref:DNA adenine methylase n=1 Tax=Brevibacillus laterosporus TaxID=1465 RepID=UPI003D1D98D4
MVASVEKEWWKGLDLNYTGENNFASFFSSNGNIHSYPAKAVPEMVVSLLKKLKEEYSITKVLDPFVGSGTVALECKYLGLDFYGSDLNPLSILLARTKSLTVNNTSFIEKSLKVFIDSISKKYISEKLIELYKFDNIEYWFKPQNIKELSFIKREIHIFLQGYSSQKDKETFALILLTAFSSTIRESSLTRNGEFKLYRMSPGDIDKFNIDSLLVFKNKIENLLSLLVETKKISKSKTITDIQMKNAKELSHLSGKKIDAILTSPPYGDSQSTVAYGQFSRLSLQWSKDLLSCYLGITTTVDNVDEYLLGGKKSACNTSLRKVIRSSITLSNLFYEMRRVCQKDTKHYRTLICELKKVMKSIDENKLDISILLSNKELYELVKERVRLDYYRVLNKQGVKSNKEIKVKARELTELFMFKLTEVDLSTEMIKELASKLPFVKDTLHRKVTALPRRVKSVLHFFKELYIVVEQTDRVLVDGGVQAWIVGHRTILGSITVDMAEVLNDWFVSFGYDKVITLHRQYSFKRLPHHINSTVTRKNEIKTMMEEHIVIVRKPKTPVE